MTTLYGWTGKILKVDLSRGETSTIDTADYVPQYVGGMGVAARLAWDEFLRPGMDAFAPDNPLFLMVGPLTGTLASGGGRVLVAGVAPQLNPSVFSRSGMGGHWGAELKFAGYDGIVIVGQAERPVYLWIHDGEAELCDATDLWGTGTYGTTAVLRGRHGAKTRVVSIGQAGENGSRIACLQTETGNAAGQGGFGGLMGSKRLKAIAVRGTGGVAVADPQRLLDLCLNASREGLRPAMPGGGPPRRRPDQPEFMVRRRKCGFCATQCGNQLMMDVPGEVTPGTYNVEMMCYGFRSTSMRAHVETRALVHDYGLNGWEIAFGIIPWLQMCRQHGLIDTIDGHEIPVPDEEIFALNQIAAWPGELTTRLARMIALREGELGDALADGACYAGERLFGGRGAELLDRIYPRRVGETNHWNGHWGTGGDIYFPFWLVPVLQWCIDTRDPASDATHGYSTHLLSYVPEHGPHRGPVPMEAARAVCAKVYGEAGVCDPTLAYERPETKAIPAIWHHDRGMIVDSLVLCDYEHTRVFSMESEDGAADTALMSKLFSAATGCETSEAELDRAGERIWNLHRAIDIRNHGRDRTVDESTIDGFMYPGKDDGVTPDREQLVKLLQTYYRLRGWNGANGWPTRARLEALDLADVADGLERIGRLG